jgi:hypothetical protein
LARIESQYKVKFPEIRRIAASELVDDALSVPIPGVLDELELVLPVTWLLMMVIPPMVESLSP